MTGTEHGKDVRRWLPHLNAIYRGLFHPVTVGVRAAVIDPQDRICLVRHTYVDGWHLPRGGVEIGETAEAALERELREEAGIQLVGRPMLHGAFFNRDASPRDHVFVYVARSFSWTGRQKANREIAEVEFFPTKALPTETAPSTRRRISEITSGGAPARTW